MCFLFNCLQLRRQFISISRLEISVTCRRPEAYDLDSFEELKMTERLIVCTETIPVCYRMNANGIGSMAVPGYHCVSGTCVKCPVGAYGTDGQFCNPCPFATWAPTTGQSQCDAKFTYSAAGKHDLHIPFGVNKIHVQLWGAGGGADKSLELDGFVSYSGGSGGYLSCNVTVPMGEKAYVIVGGGGGAGAVAGNRRVSVNRGGLFMSFSYRF